MEELKKEIINKMADEMPYYLETKIKPYISESMEIYAKGCLKQQSKEIEAQKSKLDFYEDQFGDDFPDNYAAALRRWSFLPELTEQLTDIWRNRRRIENLVWVMDHQSKEIEEKDDMLEICRHLKHEREKEIEELKNGNLCQCTEVTHKIDMSLTKCAVCNKIVKT